MSLALVRVDERLLHGQVALGWAGTLGCGLIVIANDEVAGNTWLRKLYAGAAPPEVRVEVWTLDQAAGRVDRLARESEVAILVVKTPGDLVSLCETGVRLKKVNVGGMYRGEGKRRLLPYVCVDEEDVRALRRLLDLGVDVVAQDVPGGRCYDVRPLLEKTGP